MGLLLFYPTPVFEKEDAIPEDFNQRLEKWIIDYSISKNYRGRGLGKQIISMTIALFKNGVFYGQVKSNNIASKKAFESNGFTKLNALKSNTDNIVIYEYKKN